MVRPQSSQIVEKIKLGKSIVAEKNKSFQLIDTKVKIILQTSIKPNSSGAYISLSDKYIDHKAYVVIMEEKCK